MILQSRPCNCRNIVPGEPHKDGQCTLCWHAEHTPKFRAAWGIDGLPTAVDIGLRADAGTDAAAPCGCCAECDEPIGVYAGKPEDIRGVGVVVGTFGAWPSLIDLQVRAIRRTCGNVPILIADDGSPARDELHARAVRYGVPFHSNLERIGHTGGDLSVFRRGIEWAATRNLTVLAKLSQRFIFTAGRWLQDGAAELLASGLPLAARECSGHSSFDLRTEAVLLDVAAWNTPRVLADLGPRRFWHTAAKGLNAERVLKRVMQDHVSEHYWPWSILPNGRDVERTGFVWHVSNQLGCYQGLAKKLGVELDPGFHTNGWEAELGNGSYLHG